MHKISLKSLGGASFEASVEGQEKKLFVGQHFVHGGVDSGVKPKHLMLVALGGCTALDVSSLIEKMRLGGVVVDVDVEGDVSAEHPVVYTEFRVRYYFKYSGSENLLDQRKLWKIVELSQQRYCGVSAMYKTFARVDYSVWLNGEELFR